MTDNESCRCDLCGSPGGKKRNLKEPPKYGRPVDIAVAKFPFYTNVCDRCRTALSTLEKLRKEAIEKRDAFIDEERHRRKKEGLHDECGGEVVKSGPYLVYEGCYETKYRCTQCGKEWGYT